MPPVKRLIRPALRRGGYGAVETAVVVVTVSVLIVVVATHYRRTINEANETALRAELSTLRSTITLFLAIRGRCPGELKELMGAKYVLAGGDGFISAEADMPANASAAELPDITRKKLFDAKYLEAYAVDSDGNLLDPFGLPYAYDHANCIVRSSTPKYEGW